MNRNNSRITETEIENKVSEYYENIRYKKSYSLFYHKWWIQKMLSYIDDKDGRMLDNGCGTGILFELLPKDNIFGVDISEKMLVKAKARNCKVVLGDSQILPFRSGSFDVIFSRGLVHHLHNPTQGIAEMHRVLKRGGEIVLADTNESILSKIPRILARKGGHFSKEHKNFNKFEYLKFIEEKFEIEKVLFFGYFAYPLMVLPDLIDIFKWVPFKKFLSRVLIKFDELISQIPLLNTQSWAILVKARKRGRS